MLEKINEIIDYWFGEHYQNTDLKKLHQSRHWDHEATEFDEALYPFEDILFLAHKGSLRYWQEQPRSCLAFILLTHEFSQRIHRESPLVYDLFDMAVLASEHGRTHKLDKELDLIQRFFFYRPYSTSENLSNQKLSLALINKLVNEAKAKNKPLFRFFEARYGEQVDNYDIILNFGRFPQRNEILDRESTQEELLFLGFPDNEF